MKAMVERVKVESAYTLVWTVIRHTVQIGQE